MRNRFPGWSKALPRNGFLSRAGKSSVTSQVTEVSQVSVHYLRSFFLCSPSPRILYSLSRFVCFSLFHSGLYVNHSGSRCVPITRPYPACRLRVDIGHCCPPLSSTDSPGSLAPPHPSFFCPVQLSSSRLYVFWRPAFPFPTALASTLLLRTLASHPGQS